MERFGEISELKAKIGYLGFVVFKKGLYVQTDKNPKQKSGYQIFHAPFSDINL